MSIASAAMIRDMAVKLIFDLCRTTSNAVIAAEEVEEWGLLSLFKRPTCQVMSWHFFLIHPNSFLIHDRISRALFCLW